MKSNDLKIANILEEIIPNAFSFKMVKVKGGTFRMGANSSATEGEKTSHKVTVPDFYISPYLVTNSEYAIFLNEYGSETVLEGQNQGKEMVAEFEWGIQKQDSSWYAAKRHEQHPIFAVTWYGAIAYCDWLNKKTGRNYRLPSESEWEFAARGGNKSKGFSYSGSHRLKEVGWYDKNSYGETQPIGLKLSNELDLYDMSGNVWEWCTDYWHADYQNAPDDGSAWLSEKDENRRVVRGGSWSNNDDDCLVYTRYGDDADVRCDNYGFRLARY